MSSEIAPSHFEQPGLRPKQDKMLKRLAGEMHTEMESLREQGQFYVGSPRLEALRKTELAALDAVLTEP